MAKRKRIPRPRHLFPDFAAPVIHCQRGLLRVGWWLREERDWHPTWSIGAIAGTAGIMLATLLFFISDGNVTAAPNSAPQVAAMNVRAIPNLDKFPLEVPTEVLPEFPNLEVAAADLAFSSLTRTRLNFDLKQELLVTSTAQLERDPLPPDFWSQRLPRANDASEFRPYATLALEPIVSLELPTSKDAVTPFDFINSYRNPALQIEKVMTVAAQVGQPFTYEIHVTNTSTDAIDHVAVREQVSVIDRVANVVPDARVSGDQLVWELGRLDPADSRILKVTILPDEGGEISTQAVLTNVSQIGSLASAESAAQVAPVATVEPEPAIVLQEEPEDILPVLPETAPVSPVIVEPALAEPITVEPATVEPTNIEPEIVEPVFESPPASFVKLELLAGDVSPLVVGENLTVEFTVTNVGTAVGEEIILYVVLSDHFGHKHGEYVRHRIDRLAPQESRRAVLRARTLHPGNGTLTVTLEHAETEAAVQKIGVRVRPQQSGMRSQGLMRSEADIRPVPTPAKNLKADAQTAEQDGWMSTSLR